MSSDMISMWSTAPQYMFSSISKRLIAVFPFYCRGLKNATLNFKEHYLGYCLGVKTKVKKNKKKQAYSFSCIFLEKVFIPENTG